MGDTKRYKVGGMDSGNGRPYPSDTILNLTDEQAEAMGLKGAKKADASPEAKPATAPAKPAKATTKKRPAPSSGRRKRAS